MARRFAQSDEQPNETYQNVQNGQRIAVQSASVARDSVRLDSYNGRDHVVGPVVAVKEGVLKGKLLPNEEIKAASSAFAGVPLPVGHPTEAGKYTTANTPERLTNESVGRFFGPNAEGGSLKGELWIDVEKSNELAAERGAEYALPLAMLSRYLEDGSREAVEIDANAADLLESFEAMDDGPGDLLEVSTAYWFSENDESGEFEGNAYEGVQTNLRPDHLAVLPTAIGECSVEDGCGAPRANATDELEDTPLGAATSHTVEDRMAALEAATDGGQTTTADDDGSDGTNSTTNDSGTQKPQDSRHGFGTRAAVMAQNAATDAKARLLSALRGDSHQNMKPEELSKLTGLSTEAIEAMCDDDRAQLESLAGDGQDGQDGQGDPTGNAGTQTVSVELDDELKEQFESLQGELDDVRSRLDEQNQSRREDALESLESAGIEVPDSMAENASADELEALAESAPSAGTDRRGQVGMGAGFGGNADGGDDGRADKEQAAELVAQMKGEQE